MARDLGISHRRLNGWEPRRVTVNEYDDAGLLVRSVTSTEVEWTPAQRDLMLAYDAIKSDYGPHGHRMSEATHPLANEPGSGFGFRGVPEPIIDKVEVERERVRKAYKAANPDADMTGLIFVVEKVGEVPS